MPAIYKAQIKKTVDHQLSFSIFEISFSINRSRPNTPPPLNTVCNPPSPNVIAAFGILDANGFDISGIFRLFNRMVIANKLAWFRELIYAVSPVTIPELYDQRHCKNILTQIEYTYIYLMYRIFQKVGKSFKHNNLMIHRQVCKTLIRRLAVFPVEWNRFYSSSHCFARHRPTTSSGSNGLNPVIGIWVWSTRANNLTPRDKKLKRIDKA